MPYDPVVDLTRSNYLLTDLSNLDGTVLDAEFLPRKDTGTSVISETWEWGATPASYNRLLRALGVFTTNSGTYNPTILDYVALTTTGGGFVPYQNARSSSVTVGPAGTNGYADNHIAQFNLGATASGCGDEVNLNNNAAPSGDSVNVVSWSPFTAPNWRTAHQVIGGGNFLGNYAYGVGAIPTGPVQFGRGFATFGPSCKYAGVQLSDTSSNTGVRIDGNQSVGVDTTGAAAMNYALVFKAGQAIQVNVANGGRQVIGVDNAANGKIVLGAGMDAVGLASQPIVNNGLTNAINDAAASTAGVPVNGFYRNGSVVMIRVS